MELSVVNHEDYLAKIGDDHKFPINKFGELADYLIKKKLNKFANLIFIYGKRKGCNKKNWISIS